MTGAFFFLPNFHLFVCFQSFTMCVPFVNNMDICFWCQNSWIVWIVSKFYISKSYEFRIRTIHQFVSHIPLSISTVSNNVNAWSIEAPLSLFIFQFFTHKIFTTTLQQTRLIYCLWIPKPYIQHLSKHKYYVRVKKHRKPCVLFLTKLSTWSSLQACKLSGKLLII